MACDVGCEVGFYGAWMALGWRLDFCHAHTYAPLGLADYDFFLGIADMEGGFAVADHEDDGQGTEASDEHGRHYHYLAGE